MSAPRYSVGTLCFYGFTRFFAGESTKIVRGSSRYTFEEGELLQKPRPHREQKPNTKTPEEKMLDYREYRLNKKVVRRKIFALYHLPQCQRYFRLWTLTYPIGLQDHIAYKILNTFLTRMRQEMGLKHYVWVAERQGNGTLHFHFIFTQFLEIHKANGIARATLRGCIKRGEVNYSLDAVEKYNGLDVSRKVGSFKAVAKYLTKYVTKNPTTSARLPYYCSQSVSRLFTCQWVDDARLDKWQEDNHLQVGPEPLFTTDYFSFTAVAVQNYSVVFSELFIINEAVWAQENTE